MYGDLIKKLTLTLFCLVVSCAVEASTLHLIYLGDTEDDKVGNSVNIDIGNFQEEAKRICENTGLVKHEIVLTGNKNTSRSMLQVLQTLKVEKDDVILFYYSGHGYRTPAKGNPWPNIVFTKEWKGIDLHMIIDRLKEKNPRLLIALSDCCNNPLPRGGAPQLVRGPMAKSSQNRTPPRVQANYRHLFLDAQGVIIGVAAKKGQTAKSNNVLGGNYTYAFLKVLNHYTTKTAQANWIDILETTKEILKEKQEGEYCIQLH